MIKEISSELSILVENTAKILKSVDKDLVSIKPAPNKWSIKEILGHLIDSAVNNHNRFVRAQEVDFLESPGYHQDFWVSVQSYNTVPWMSWWNSGNYIIYFLHILLIMYMKIN